MLSADASAADRARSKYEEHLTLIEDVIRFACRRRALLGDEADDFRSYVHVKLMQNEFRIIRRFQGNSALRTYLITVINRLGLDYRIEKWGKWRPSASARRLGEPAISLERLLHREGLTFDEALETVIAAGEGRHTRDDLTRLADQLPSRQTIRVDDRDLDTLEGGIQPADERILQDERRKQLRQAYDRMGEVLGGLALEDRMILRLRYHEGIKVSAIAVSLGLDQKPLYRRIAQLLAHLRAELEKRGIHQREIEELLRAP